MSVGYDVRLRALMRVRQDPRLLRLLYGRTPRIAGPQTEVVIEGIQRSANSFAVRAFRSAQQPRVVIIAHHLHAAAQFELAAEYRIPAICLVRDPVDAVASLMIRAPNVSVDLGLRLYSSFYRRAMKFSDAFVVSPFEEVISHFGASIARLNTRFGTNWKPYHNAPEIDELVFEQIRARNRQKYHETNRSNMVAVPTPGRQEAAAAIREQIREPLFERLLADAQSLHDSFVAMAGLPETPRNAEARV